MSDIRRISLDQRQAQVVESTPMEAFKLGTDRAGELEKVLPEIIKLDYWDPDFQAWEPFVVSYLRSGITPQLAATWLPKFSSKIEELGPKSSRYHNMFAEVLHMSRATSVECFQDYTWDEISSFVDWLPTYIDNRRTITRFLFDSERYMGLLNNLLKKEDGSVYSKNLPYAVYLYRHCMLDIPPYTQELFTEMQSQLDAYASAFQGSFKVVSNFIGESAKTYKWYCSSVQNIISKAWRSSLDLTENRSIITAKDVFSMPVWLSEQLTDYVASLPCSYTVPVDQLFILDALSYALQPEVKFDNPDMIYSFCIPKTYLKRFFDRLSLFYWDVKEGRFVAQLRAMVNAQYTNSGDQNAKTPDEYVEELKLRGFPIGG